MDSEKYFKKIQELKAQVVARESFLRDLNHKVHRARRIFADLNPRALDQREFFNTVQKFVNWLHSFIRSGMTDIQGLDETFQAGHTRLCYETTMKIQGKRIKGIFIPLPSLLPGDLDTNLKDTSVQTDTLQYYSKITGTETETYKQHLVVSQKIQTEESLQISSFKNPVYIPTIINNRVKSASTQTNLSSWSNYSSKSTWIETSTREADCQTKISELQFIEQTLALVSVEHQNNFISNQIITWDELVNRGSWSKVNFDKSPEPSLSKFDSFELGIKSSSCRIQKIIKSFENFILDFNDQVLPSRTHSEENLIKSNLFYFDTEEQELVTTTEVLPRKSVSSSDVFVSYKTPTFNITSGSNYPSGNLVDPELNPSYDIPVVYPDTMDMLVDYLNNLRAELLKPKSFKSTNDSSNIEINESLPSQRDFNSNILDQNFDSEDNEGGARANQAKNILPIIEKSFTSDELEIIRVKSKLKKLTKTKIPSHIVPPRNPIPDYPRNTLFRSVTRRRSHSNDIKQSNINHRQGHSTRSSSPPRRNYIGFPPTYFNGLQATPTNCTIPTSYQIPNFFGLQQRPLYYASEYQASYNVVHTFGKPTSSTTTNTTNRRGQDST